MALSIALVACGDDDDDDTGDTGSEATATETTDSGDTGDTGDEGEDGDSGDVAYDGTITFGDYGWDSDRPQPCRAVRYRTRLGIETDSVAGRDDHSFPGGSSIATLTSRWRSWVDQQPQFEPEVEAGTIIDYGPNYPNSIQGWWVPTYMIEGDEERGIELMTPIFRASTIFPNTPIPEDPGGSGQGAVSTTASPAGNASE
ncbi:MAG: hypothetical protein R2849_10610 [Thermomicrobiales bacterium]